MRVRVGEFSGNYALRRLVAEAFVKNYPEGKTQADISELFIVHKDGDCTNVNAANLRWAADNTNNYLDILNADRVGDDVLHVIPSIPLYAVSRNCELRNLVYGTRLANSKNKLGYIRARFKKTEANKTNLLHRLIGEVFVPPKDGYTIQQCVAQLDINHINLDKSDCSPSNLEWVTKTENTLHLYENGARTDIDRLVVRDVTNNEVKVYRSLHYFSEVSKIPLKALKNLARTKVLDKVIVENFTFSWYLSGKEPPTLSSILSSGNHCSRFERNDGLTIVCHFRFFARFLPFTAKVLQPFIMSETFVKVGKWSVKKQTT